jgi:proline iminopeptidase
VIGVLAAALLTVTEGFVPGADGVRLYYRRIGEGRPAIVYLHGGPGQNFNGGGPEMEPLAASRSLVLYDQRGAGRSEVVSDPERLTVGHHVRDLEALRQHFGFRRMVLVGLSWGSGLAVSYAAAHPDRVERVVLVSPMPPARTPYFTERLAAIQAFMGPADVAELRAAEAAFATASDAEIVALCRRMAALSMRPYVVDPSRLHSGPGDRCDIPLPGLRNRARVRDATLGSLGDWDFRPAMAGLRAPALVLEGSKTVVPLAATRIWAATIPDARFLLIPDAGHEMFVDQPAAFLRAVEPFLKGRWPPGAERVAASR